MWRIHYAPTRDEKPVAHRHYGRDYACSDGGADDDEMKSLFGTFGTWRDVLRESAMRFKADIGEDSLFNRGEITLATPAESLFIRPLSDLDHCLAVRTTGRTRQLR
jgi:hypothetical protein